ncbi:MAG: hypothetical protein IJ721_09770 [Bacteroidales bacterium]|nr:hypothetical protein [Bacteroidales bacterium]
MKKILYLTAALLCAAACTKGTTVPPQEDGVERVTFTMGLNLPQNRPVTRAMGETPAKDLHVYVLVFGSSGNFNDLVEVFPASDADFSKDGQENYHKEYIVSLRKTESHQSVHVIAMPGTLDFATLSGGATEAWQDIMKTLVTQGTDDGYWQYIDLPGGTATAAEAFRQVRLVRNFAKLSVKVSGSVALPSGVTFNLLGFETYNKPSEGSFAIIKDGAFYSGYADATLDALRENYPGYMPDESAIDTENAGKWTDEDGKAQDYLYERPEPTANPTFILMKCTWNGEVCYYRMDLMDSDGGYLPIYRNFLYTLRIDKVSKKGYATPEEAANYSFNGNISTDLSTQELEDISDGLSRMYVQYIEKVFVRSELDQTGYFRYKFLPDATQESASAAASLTVPTQPSLIVPAGGWTEGGTKAADAWYDLEYTVKADQEGLSTFRVTGQTGSGTLVRNIRIRVLPVQTLTVSPATQTIASGGSGSVCVTLPEGLPSSMFPIELTFEDSASVLNPDYGSENGKDMTASGSSSLTGSGKNAVQFIKTVTWAAYQDGQSFTAAFKRLAAGTTNLYIGTTYFKTEKVTIN